MSIGKEFDHGGERLRVRVERLDGDRFRVHVGANEHEVVGKRLPDGRVRFEFDGRTIRASASPVGTGKAAIRRGDVHVTVGDDSWILIGHSGTARTGHDTDADGVIVAPMTGTVLKILVSEGDEVTASDTVAVVSAMKMEHKLLAGIDGTVTEVAAQPGATVDQDQHLITITPVAK